VAKLCRGDYLKSPDFVRLTAHPSQNRTWCVTPSGSQFEFSPKVSHLLCQTDQSRCHGLSRSVSGHVSLTCSPKPAPLCSVCITRPRRSYGYLRLPTASALFLASYTCPRVRFLLRRLPDLPGYRVVSMRSSTRPKTPGRALALASHVQRTVACWPINTIGLSH